ncbi:toll/interleukin-1 receptor domain-containing protein [Mucilaginibacter kameinonensis]|uniref:toll/interleukin-1 receptor domain-containing protein n=1 Tax=Mucilaginibacter kameinonensis TaxID=452286 RepID=UPI000EF7B63B|nr:toll/interleukin-1 receptor domain-containing protein [Mucilaginibacter kameinonensis]
MAEVQFDVDEGVFSTNVSRLQRIIRESDAFIGIYPFPGTEDEARNFEELRKQSRYFRLEMDMAIRSNKPVIVFYDRRYRDLIRPVPGAVTVAFNHRDVTGTGGYANQASHEKAFQEFANVVERHKAFEVSLNRPERTKVLLFSSSENQEYIDQLSTTIRDHYFAEPLIVRNAPVLDAVLQCLLAEVDLVIIDEAQQPVNTGLVAYLHGRFVPAIRLQYQANEAIVPMSLTEQFLFSGLEIGYRKDLIIWTNRETLIEELAAKLDQICSDIRRINTYNEAANYFNSASLRKEAIFVSYSGKDIEVAQAVITVLKKHFQTVFDYRDGASIQPGKPWLNEIFEKLAVSAIGINLFSENYFQSENCKHEALQMVANHDNGKLRLFPVKLYEQSLEIPSYFQSIQYLRYYELKNDPEKLIGIILKLINSL